MKQVIEPILKSQEKRTFLENSVLAIEATEIDKAKEIGNYSITHKRTNEEVAEVYIFILPQSRKADYVITLNRNRMEMDFLAMLTNAIGAIIQDFKTRIIK